MAHHREWGEIMQFVRLSVNFLMIIVATATIASGAGLLLTTLAWIDLGLAFFDIAVQLFEEELRKTEWGRKFLEIWDTIYTIGGIVTGAPLLGQLLVNGTKALARITNAEAKIKLAAMLKAALLKTNNFPKYLSGKFEIIVDLLERIKTGFKYPQLVSIAGKLQKLQKEGVLIIKSVTKIDGKIVKKYVLIYKDAIIAEGKTGAELRQAIKKFFGPNGKVMIGALEEAVEKINLKNLIKYLDSLNDSAKATDLDDFGIKVLFRGTTKNADNSIYVGNTNSQQFGLSTSTDPLRAIIFAIESATESGKKGVIQIILTKDLKGIKLEAPNRMVGYELEVVLKTSADNLANFVVKEILIDEARTFANEFFKLSESLPTKIYKDTREAEYLMKLVYPKTNVSESYTFYKEIIKQ